METNNFFNAWLETQKQLMNNWKESNEKLQEAVKSGSAMKDGMSIYQEWLAKQSEITKKANEEAVKSFQSQVAKGAETLKNGSAAGLNDMYNNWMKTQREMTEKAFGAFRNYSQPFTANNQFATETMNKMQDFQQQWWNGTQSWMNQSGDFAKNWMDLFQNWGKGLNDTNVKEAWGNMMNYSGAFMKFYEMWSPAYKNMLNNSFTNEWMKNAFNAESFRELTDRTISWISPVQYKELFSQWQNWTEVAANYGKHVYQQFSGSVPETMKSLYPFLAFGNNPDNPYNNIFSVYQRALSPLVKLFNPGKEAEMNEHIVGMGEKMAVYGQKLAELQQHIYATAAQSWETFVLENYEQVKKGADLSNTQEAFQKWINRNEEVFIGLFRSEEYSKLQGELLDLGLEIRQHAEKAGEIVLQPFPVVLRSEADDLYTTVYELRKRISALEKQQQESETETKEPKSSAKKKTATV